MWRGLNTPLERAVLIWVSRAIRVYIIFAFPRFVIGLKKLTPLSQPMRIKSKPIVTCWRTLSRALRASCFKFIGSLKCLCPSLWSTKMITVVPIWNGHLLLSYQTPKISKILWINHLLTGEGFRLSLLLLSGHSKFDTPSLSWERQKQISVRNRKRTL